MARRLRAVALALAVAAGGGACSKRPPAPTPAAPDPIAHLRTYERERRQAAHFVQTKSQDRAFGADPYRVVSDGDRVLGILRGDDALVVLDGTSLRELRRAPTLRSPSSVTIYVGPPREPNLLPGDILVASDVEPTIAHYRDDQEIRRLEDLSVGDVRYVREIVSGPEGAIHVLEEREGRMYTLGPWQDSPSVEPMAPGPTRAVRLAHHLVTASVLGHSLTVREVDHRARALPERARDSIDGPFWSLDAIDLPTDGEALILAGGVEDHPLDRRGGFFGYVDSFIYLYRFSNGSLRRTGAINVGEHGLVVPKAVVFDLPWHPQERRLLRTDVPFRAIVTGYGSEKALRLVWRNGADAPPDVEPIAARPGISSLVALRGGLVGADPLLDEWVAFVGDDVATARVSSATDERTARERLGEALFFTSLMAPTGSSDGAKSRFTCETCHFEGYVDGRVHHTGRGEVRAATKPLVGLFNNRPYFSRALDPDLAAVAENEFRVAGAPSPVDPHFSLKLPDAPWLADLALDREAWDPAELRLSLMSFLMAWNHRINPAASTRRGFGALERAGAEAFRARCEGCHQARTASDAPASRAPFESWERAIFDGGPIVWGTDAYAKTGVEPYVHDRGARVPSLRRLYKKRPYFTNGRAPDLRFLLARARFLPDGSFLHQGPALGERLTDTEVDALAAFLELL